MIIHYSIIVFISHEDMAKDGRSIDELLIASGQFYFTEWNR